VSDFTRQAYARSVDLLHHAVTPHGFVASPSFDHYAVVWGRDALISSLGALTVRDRNLTAAAADTLDTLAAHASPLGQIPALVSPARGEWDFAEGGAVDVSAWFVIAAAAHLTATDDVECARRWWPSARAAFRWLTYQDVTGSGLISAAPATDWMDAALTRSGRTLHLNVLYAWAAAALAEMSTRLGEDDPTIDPARLRDTVNAWFWPVDGVDPATLYPHGFAHDATRIAYWEAARGPRRHYVSHIVHAAFVERCDVLANLLAVRAAIADPARAALILDAVAPAADPFPTRTFPQPISPGDGTAMLVSVAEASIPDRWQNRPGRYHNGAAWPYVGGFHVEAVAQILGPDAARPLLLDLAAANAVDDWAFPEWIDAEGNAAGARLQTWNAGTYLLAHQAVGGV
jgi:glycogen debranching enzyme